MVWICCGVSLHGRGGRFGGRGHGGEQGGKHDDQAPRKYGEDQPDDYAPAAGSNLVAQGGDPSGDVFAGETELRALNFWFGVMNEHVGDADAFHRHADPPVVEKLQTAEPKPPASACSSSVMKRVCVSASSISKFSSSGLTKRMLTTVGLASSSQQLVGIECDVHRHAERQNRDAPALPQHFGPAHDDGCRNGIPLPLELPRG